MVTKTERNLKKTKSLKLTRVWTNHGNLYLDDPRYGESQLEIEVPIGINYSCNGRIIIHSPGARESVRGYKDKYFTLANFLRDKGLAAVVCTDSNPREGHPIRETLYDDLRFVIEYAFKNSMSICGCKKPEICLMGFSVGASAIARVAHEFPGIEKILLMGPGMGNWNATSNFENLAKYIGDVYIVQGESDHVRCGQRFYDMALNARSRHLVIIPNCDHHFRHETNDKIYSKAAFWALGEENLLEDCKPFPDSDGGIRLVQNVF